MNFSTRVASYNAAVDAAIDGYISEREIHPKLREAMHYSLFAGGKRFRPTLTLAVADMLEGDKDSVIALAAAIEMIHTYSLIHDDLPCMDNDDLRRGKPTSHKRFGEANAILAGDALLNYAFEILLEELPRSKDMIAFANAAGIIAKATGPSGLLSGQVADLQNENNMSAGELELTYIHKNKTGALICAAVLSSAAVCSRDENVMQSLKYYGEQIGLAFQIADDILDVTGDPALLGKSIGKDEAASKLTFVRVFGIEKSREMAMQCASNAKSALDSFGERAWFLREMADFVVNRAK